MTEKKYPPDGDAHRSRDARPSGRHTNVPNDRPPREGEAPRGRRPAPGNRERDGQRDRDGGRSFSGKGPSGGPRGREDRTPDSAARALIDLDRELMKLLVRRATLVSRVREGKDSPATPASAQAEKTVRIAWETAALSFSKDPRFSRQLFALLQDIRILSKSESEQSTGFSLAPQPGIISGTMTGPTSVRTAQMRLALAAGLGKSLCLHPLMISSALNDTCKVCEQAGATLSREDDGPALSRLTINEGKPLAFAGKSLYCGDNVFTVYLFAFLALGQPGVCRLNGGPELNAADLTPLRHTLPLFGARLAHIVPHSQGLPASLECSGTIPPYVLVPADLPEEALSALLLAPLVWGTPVTLDLSALPATATTAALAEVRPLHRDSGAEVETHGPKISFIPSPVSPPAEPALPLDPALAAYFLCLPAFRGGSLEMRGIWPSRMPEAAEAEQLFAWAGLECTITENSVTTRKPSEEDLKAKPVLQSFSLPMQSGDISPALGPLFLVLAALCLKTKGTVPSLESLLSFPEEDTDKTLAAELFARLGIVLDNGLLTPAGADASRQESPSWTSPDAFWAMAYALGSFLRPGLNLANPGVIANRMPAFWGIYNSLPVVKDAAGKKAKEEADDGKPARRRIIAD